MALVPIDIPPGAHHNGTDLGSAGRWHDVSLVRWRQGSIRPIGGWTNFLDDGGDPAQVDSGNSIARGAVAWFDNSGVPRVAFGSADGLFSLNGDGTLAEITPAGLAAGNESSAERLGYGGKAYGEEAYGTQRSSDGTLVGADVWTLDTWGEYLVGCSTADGKLYEWQLDDTTPTVAAQISNAPTLCRAVLVTGERIMMALGASADPRLIKWSDKEDNTQWTAASTNEAGDITLQTNGLIQTGVKVRGGNLILTTTDAWLGAYLGPPLVYGFNKVGSGCGLVAVRAIAEAKGGAFWMGRNEFFVYDGNTVAPLPCEVADYVFTDINRSEIDKVYAVNNQRFSEVWWFYPCAGATENDRYVFYDYQEGVWGFGHLERTCGVDAGVFNYPVWIDPDGYVTYQENGNYHGGVDPHAETGPLMMDNGNRVGAILRIFPDEEVKGEATITLKTRFFPNGTQRSYGPYTAGEPTSVRVKGRYITMRLDGADGTNFRVGRYGMDVRGGSGR